MKISVHALLILATTAKGNQECDVFIPQNDIDGCSRANWHKDPEGMVCGNDGQDNEAYCNYRNYREDVDACVYGRCGNTPAQVYEHRDWDELPPNVQNLYEDLGYSDFWWDWNYRPWPAAWQYWRDLSDAHKRAASALGYTQSSWDSADAGECGGEYSFECYYSTEVGCNDRSQCHWIAD